MYACPLYLYPLRTGSRERPSWMLNLDLKSGWMLNLDLKSGWMLKLDLKSGDKEPDVRTERGTALLLALAE